MSNEDRTQRERMESFLSAENWFDGNQRLEAIYRTVSRGDELEIVEPLFAEHIRVMFQALRAQHEAILVLADELDELSKDQ